MQNVMNDIVDTLFEELVGVHCGANSCNFVDCRVAPAKTQKKSHRAPPCPCRCSVRGQLFLSSYGLDPAGTLLSIFAHRTTTVPCPCTLLSRLSRPSPGADFPAPSPSSTIIKKGQQYACAVHNSVQAAAHQSQASESSARNHRISIETAHNLRTQGTSATCVRCIEHLPRQAVEHVSHRGIPKKNRKPVSQAAVVVDGPKPVESVMRRKSGAVQASAQHAIISEISSWEANDGWQADDGWVGTSRWRLHSTFVSTGGKQQNHTN